MREVITDGITGFLTPARDDSRLAERILRLIADAKLRQRMGCAGQMRAQDCFDEARMCADYVRLYLDMCSVQRGRGMPV